MRVGVNQRRAMENRRATRNERMVVASRWMTRRGWKAVAIVTVLAIVGAGAWQLVSHIDLGRWIVLKHVEVRGNQLLSWDDILGVAKVEMGQSLMEMNSDSIQKQLERHDLIVKANVSRSFPSTLKIQVTEATPLFLVNSVKGWRLYSDKGTLIPARPDLGFQLPVADAVGQKKVLTVCNFLASMKMDEPELYREASQVMASGSGKWLEVYFRNTRQKVLFPIQSDAAVFHRYRLLVQSMQRDLQNVNEIDMRFPGFAIARSGVRENQDG